YREDLIKELFTSLLNQRLNELTRSSKPPFLYAATSFNSYARGFEGFTGFAVAAKDGPEASLKALLTEIERVKKYGFTQPELDREKKDLLASFEQVYNNRDKTESANFVDEYVRSFLQHEPIPGIAKEYEYYKTLVPEIKLEEVNAIIAKLKQNEHILVSLQGPDAKDIKLPDDKQLLAEAETALKADVKPYEEKTLATELLKTKPQSGNIVSETKNEKLGVTEITFSNGAKAILKPTDFKDDEIVMTSFHKGGLSKYPAEDKFSSTFASTIVQQMGVGDFSPTDLQKFLSGKTVSASANISNLSAGINGKSSVKDFETLLQLTYLFATSPRKDESLFNGWKDKQKAQMQFALADPQTAFIDTFYKVLYQQNPLAPVVLPKPEEFDNINLDRSLAIYNEQFGDAKDFNFIFVGSFDVEKIKPLLARYIGGLPSANKPASYIDNGVRRVKGDVDFTFKKGTDPKSLIIKIYSGEIPYSDDLALKADALKEVLNIKIIEDLREKLSAIYGGGIFGGINKLPYNNYAL
ncbi:MAG: insulinase family protein, partial [Bacteroidetes bacterium]|nr:insulinase family protein [Bacteroidota bacterium]